MSTQYPLKLPAIPSPTGEPQSVVQSLWALQQNVEVRQGTRGTAIASGLHSQSALTTSLKNSIRYANPRP